MNKYIISAAFCLLGFRAMSQETPSLKENKVDCQIVINPKLCTYTISIENKGNAKIQFIDGLRRYSVFDGAIAGGAVLHFRSSRNLLKGVDKSLLSQGYTFAASSSSGIGSPILLDTLNPGEKVEKTFNLDFIASGIYRNWRVKGEILEKCEMMMETTVGFDVNHTQLKVFRSKWIPCPECVATVNEAPKSVRK